MKSPPATEAEIKRLFRAERWKVRTIATHLGVHHDAVRRVVWRDRVIPKGLLGPGTFILVVDDISIRLLDRDIESPIASTHSITKGTPRPARSRGG